MKARFVSESIEFTRGGSDQQIKDKILGRIPLGSLFKWGGRFPYIVILVGRSEWPDQGIIQQVGIFQGGGRKKTRFRFYSPKNKERYTIPYDVMKPIPGNLWEMIKNESWDPFGSGKTYWERFEEETGIKPILPVYESVRFERGLSDADIKRELRPKGEYQAGEIIIQDVSTDPYKKDLWVYIEYNPKNYLAPHSAFRIGSIDKKTGKANLIHYTGGSGRAGLQDNSLIRRATRDEAREIRKALTSGKYDKYIDNVKKKLGLTPFV